MLPYIHIDPLRLGPLELQPFGILVAIGVFAGITLAERRAVHLGRERQAIRSFVSWVLVAGFLGAHVFDAIFYRPKEVLEDPLLLVQLFSGLSSFGGFVGAVLGAFAWKYFEFREYPNESFRLRHLLPGRRQESIAIVPLVDIILAVFPVAWTFGRAGCAVVHDHPGIRASASSWFAIASGPGSVERLGFIELRYGTLPQYDLGLLEMLVAVVLSIAFALTWRKPRAVGWYIVATCISYAPVRFVLDFLRLGADSGGDVRYGSLTPAQLACVAMFVFGISFEFWRRRQPVLVK